MKKLLGIVVLGLLLSSNAYPETVELEQGIKLNIPKGYAYVELNYKNYNDENAQGFLSNKELNEYYKNMGITGTEKVLIIGKDVVYGMVNFYQHDLDGKKPEEWEGLVEIVKKCESKNSEKAFMKCFVKTMADPYIEVFVSGTDGPLIDGLSKIIQEIKNDPDLQEEAKKFSQKIEKNFSGLGKVKGKVKAVHLDKKKWSAVVSSKTRTMGIKLTKEMYLFPHNNHVLAIASACISKKNCKDITKKVIEVLQPYLLNDIAKITETKETKKKTETKKTKKKVAKKNELDTTGPEIKISEPITVKDNTYTLEGKVSDQGSDKIYMEVDGRFISVKKGKFKIVGFSPLNEEVEVKIVARDQWGNKSTKVVKVDMNIKKKKKVVKEEVKQTDDNSDITQQLKDLNEMYKSGALTKEEFTKAKKKLLN